MTVRALFRFTGPDKSQLACIAKEDGWTAQSHADFLTAHGGDTTASFRWDNLPYVPRPLVDYPELEAALEKVREYLKDEWPVREKIASYKSQGILADEGELLGKIAELHGRLVSMYLAKAAKLFGASNLGQEPAAVIMTADDDAADRPDLKNECVAMVAAIVVRALPEELTERLSPADARDLADDMIRNVFEPKGRLREQGRRDPRKLADMVGLAALPAVAKGRRHHVAAILVEMLEHANLVGFEPNLGEADWPRLRARARRGIVA